jgi:hypothetical protein
MPVACSLAPSAAFLVSTPEGESPNWQKMETYISISVRDLLHERCRWPGGLAMGKCP